MESSVTYRTMDVRPIAGALGAEIYGADLKDRDDSPVWGELRQAFLEYHVIAVRGQDLSPDDLMRVGRKFGEPGFYPFAQGMDGFPYIHEVIKREGETENFGNDWHTDTMYVDRPPRATLLYALETPPKGGDTMFANQYLAYETLSDGMKKMLAGLRAIHTDIMVAGPQARKNKGRSTKHRDGADWRETRTAHPVVRTNPETGRKMLFVNKSYTVGFEGMTEAESKPLLDFLMDHGHRPEFTCRFRWEKGSIAFWDNRSTKHLAVNDSHTLRRYMRRVQIAGDRPV